MSQVTAQLWEVAMGEPIAGVTVSLDKVIRDNEWQEMASTVSDHDGYVNDLLSDGVALIPGVYRLTYHLSPYYEKLGIPTDFPFLYGVFEIKDRDTYHFQLFATPHGFSIYKGGFPGF